MTSAVTANVSDSVSAFCSQVNDALETGKPEAVPDESLQRVLSAAVRLYAAKSEDRARELPPFGDRPVNATEAVTAERDRLIEEKNDLMDRLLRRQAEFDNFRRRAERERADLLEFANTETVRAVLPILDDFERALKDGRKAFQPGLLASAHRGILYIDEVNLLPDHLVDVLLDGLAT